MITGSIFLLPNGTFVVELLVVVIILFLVTKYILPPLNKAMEDRQAKIRSALEAADQARAEADAAGEERAKVLAQARDQAREIVASAQAGVIRPLREVGVFLAGVRTAVRVFLHFQRPSVDQATPDDEAFLG